MMVKCVAFSAFFCYLTLLEKNKKIGKSMLGGREIFEMKKFEFLKMSDVGGAIRNDLLGWKFQIFKDYLSKILNSKSS